MSEEPSETIDRFRQALDRMASMVESRLEAATLAWLDHSSDLADSVRYADDEIDQAELDLEADCMHIMVHSSPREHEMRYLVAALRIISSLERIADLSRSISKRVMRLEKKGGAMPPVAAPMAQTVRTMTGDAIRALRTEDTELAQKVRRTDDTVDQYNRDAFKWAAESVAENAEEVEIYLDVLLLCRALERIGDLAGNMAEDIIFAVEGDVVRHSPL